MNSDLSELFTSEALSVMDRQVFDPSARPNFEVMSGGLVWSDELPRLGSPEFATVYRGFLLRFLNAYRASITLGEERVEFRPLWDQVVVGAPRWPGLREDRRGERARRRLLAAQRRQDRCLAELEAELSRPTD